MKYQEQLRQRTSWVMQNEHLWGNLSCLRVKAVEEGLYSPKLSNIEHCLQSLIDNCKQMKRKANYFGPLKPRTDLIITQSNFDELIKNREVIDLLNGLKHPVLAMDESGFTYYDYAVFKRRKHGRVPHHILDEINVFFRGGDIPYIF